MVSKEEVLPDHVMYALKVLASNAEARREKLVGL